MKKQIDSAVEKLSVADEDGLYAKLGAYSLAFSQDPKQFADPDAALQIAADTAGPLSESIKLGKRILRRWNRVLYDLTCAEADPEVKKTIVSALSLKSPEALAAAITGVLITTFSVGPAIATVVGVLLARVLLPAAKEEICKFWEEQLS